MTDNMMVELEYLINRIVPPTSADEASNISRCIETLRQALSTPRIPKGQHLVPSAFLREYLELLDQSDFRAIYKMVRREMVEAILTATPQPAEQRHFIWPNLDKPAKQSSTHRSASNPGVADQYRAEAMAARTALGFAESAKNVYPSDIRGAIATLKQRADSVVPEGWRATRNGDYIRVIGPDGSTIDVLDDARDPAELMLRNLVDALLSSQPTKQQPAPAVQGEPVAEIRIESGYWNRGHFYEGRRKELKVVSSIQDLPVGTKLYAAGPQTEMLDVARLVEALEWLRGAINATPENDKYHAGTWISSKHPRIKQIDAILAAHRKQRSKEL